MLDTAGNLRLGGLGELEFVEDVAGDPVILVGIKQPVERAGWIVRTRRRQFLMPGLKAECRRDGGKPRVERRHLHLDAPFLLLVGKGLPHAERRRIGGVREPDLVVLVIGGAGPET